MRAPDESAPVFEYTLMPTHLRSRFSVEELQEMVMAPPFEFTKGCPIMKIAGGKWGGADDFKTLLFDVENDPGQEKPLEDADAEVKMVAHMKKLMEQTDAPEELYERLGL